MKDNIETLIVFLDIGVAHTNKEKWAFTPSGYEKVQQYQFDKAQENSSLASAYFGKNVVGITVHKAQHTALKIKSIKTL